MTFDYRPSLALDAKLGVTVIYRPRIPVRVYGAKGMARYLAIVDTGSDRSLFPESIASDVGISLDQIVVERVASYGGQVLPARTVDVTLELTDGVDTMGWNARVGFVAFDDPDDEVLVLGHAGCLDHFTAVFDGKLKRLELEANDQLPAVLIP